MDAARPLDEYTARLNRAVDFIEGNLTRGPSLHEIARAAGFSSYHFHRLFSARMGETVGQLTARLRVERAAARLLDRPGDSITKIALESGFSSSAAFARAFRARFGTTASEWRRGGQGRRANARRVAAVPELPLPDVRIETWPALHFAYVRHVGPYAGDYELFQSLMHRLTSWAEPRGLLDPAARLCGIYHDAPGVTRDEQLRLSLGLQLADPETQTSGEVERLELSAGRWAVAPFDLGPSEFEDAWALVYAHWLPHSGYQPAHRPAVERYRQGGQSAGTGSIPVDICIPVEPLVTSGAAKKRKIGKAMS